MDMRAFRDTAPCILLKFSVSRIHGAVSQKQVTFIFVTVVVLYRHVDKDTKGLKERNKCGEEWAVTT
jgi:hypothetical protein